MDRQAPLAPATRPMAFVSDIHGNLKALEAVLAELATESIADIFVAGDLLLGGPDSLEVWRTLQRVGARCVRGVSDTALIEVDPRSLRAIDKQQQEMLDRFAECRNTLGDLVIEQLRRLPESLRLPLIDGTEVVMVHGSPHDASQEMSHDLSDDELLALVAGDPADIVICGATHVPFSRDVDGVRIINVGSVGAAPEGAVAHFAILTPAMSGAKIDAQWIQY